MYMTHHTQNHLYHKYAGQTNYYVLVVSQEHGIVYKTGEPWKFVKPWQQGTSCVAQVLLVIEITVVLMGP